MSEPQKPYTPSVEDLARAAYCTYLEGTSRTREESAAEFDQMLSRVRAEALREAADALNAEFQDIPAWAEAYREGVRTDEWMRGGVRMVMSAVDVLRSRANRIEREGDTDDH